MRVEIVDGYRDLEMHEWAVAKRDDILETGGASTCGIIAVLNYSQERAWMAHQMAPHEMLEDRREMLGDASFQMQSTDNIVILLAGCGPGETQDSDHKALCAEVIAYFPDATLVLHWGEKFLASVSTQAPAIG